MGRLWSCRSQWDRAELQAAFFGREWGVREEWQEAKEVGCF
jgi:hypothetical protein